MPMRWLKVIFASVVLSCPYLEAFEIVDGAGRAASVVVSDTDWKGVARAADDFAADVERVSSVRPSVVRGLRGRGSVVAGTIGKSDIIDSLVAAGRINVDSVRGRWESYVIEEVDGNLVVAGADKRGTIYGIYTLSEEIGVSPWYYMADVQPRRHDGRLTVESRRRVQPSPAVKYRGIFINDEEPSFGSWARNKFGGYNSSMYSHIFELLLRLKANYMWPAMWSSSFNEDDPLSPAMADEYGIVMGTSHHEPMMRNHNEYVRRREQIGPWNFDTNSERVSRFFREGMERNRDYEQVVTIGMRGDGDVGLEGGDEAAVRTLGRVVDAERAILSDIYGRADSVPQLWAIFTEVQRYYDRGFTVPDDVTLLFCDNNWGYIRRTGPEKERGRRGGMGLYYHIDMNGGPWNDRWVNTSPVAKLRNQFELAYRSGLDRLWVVNVGDLKPKEVAIDFIMRYAWDPDAFPAGCEADFHTQFAESVFGPEVAAAAGDIIRRYTKYNLWRKPEVQNVPWFSVENHGEAMRLMDLWTRLEADAEALRSSIPAGLDDAYYQLVYYPAVASAGVARMYLNSALYNYTGDDRYADETRRLFERDKVLSDYYNNTMAAGKWNGMMQDRHIGYERWFMPDSNRMPELVAPEIRRPLQGACTPTPEIAIEACAYTRKTDGRDNGWQFLPDLGRGRGCMGARDVVMPFSGRLADCAVLEYEIPHGLFGDSVVLAIGTLPVQDVNPARGLRIAVAVDDSEPLMLDARQGLHDEFGEYTPENLRRNPRMSAPAPKDASLYLTGSGGHLRTEVFDNMRWLTARMPLRSASSEHSVKLYLVDPEVVVEQININPDSEHPSYFGAPFNNKP